MKTYTVVTKFKDGSVSKFEGNGVSELMIVVNTINAIDAFESMTITPEEP